MPKKEKDKSASALAKKKWAKYTPEQRSEQMRKLSEKRWKKEKKYGKTKKTDNK